MKTMTVSNTRVRSIHLNLDRNLTLNQPGIKITSQSKIKTRLAMAALAALLSPALATEISLETAPPVVVKTVPVAGATDVDPALTEIRVTYSKKMRDGSWSWSTWGPENYPETGGLSCPSSPDNSPVSPGENQDQLPSASFCCRLRGFR